MSKKRFILSLVASVLLAVTISVIVSVNEYPPSSSAQTTNKLELTPINTP